ncbi:biotin synthase [Striga asiatica]|uniref:Biotin synthase n=1 Tax=Striga asiatica TaxID=4170 RepID=A0A5A7QV94_STRAF|nr:biotin synthase [Striga asiatica]
MKEPNIFGEIELGLVSPVMEGSLVICSGSGLGRVEGAEPDTGSFVRVSNLGCPFAPRPLPHASVLSMMMVPSLKNSQWQNQYNFHNNIAYLHHVPFYHMATKTNNCRHQPPHLRPAHEPKPKP